MPIVAIEGPDKCGKSTLFGRLMGQVKAKFIDVPSYCKHRMNIAAELSLRDLELWETFYEPSRLYISNRHVIVSDAVYSRLYNRPKLRWSFLEAELLVVYIDTPTDRLMHRHKICGENIQNVMQYDEVRRLYSEEIKTFRNIVVQYYEEPQVVANKILEVLHGS